ncbi:unnamed protein product [Leptidea sinapis]|uniref:Uncharacterized protein n=1 Tax=Leptidea sinapis TaxID=189913 RepID=A0A5E4Q7L1_9NEOP|nr:unnamed protein product [Leptidea sinapis]
MERLVRNKMRYIVISLCIAQYYYSIDATHPRSVNLALETVLQFDQNYDISIVETFQNFLSKLKSTLQNSRRNTARRDGNHFKFTDFIEKAIETVRAYSDIDLEHFADVFFDETQKYNNENCEILKITDNLGLRRVLSNKMSQVKMASADTIRRRLNVVLDQIRRNAKDSNFFNLINSLYKKKDEEKFARILNSLRLYRRSPKDLEKIVEDGFRSVIVDYYCDLTENNKNYASSIISSLLRGSLPSKRPRLLEIKSAENIFNAKIPEEIDVVSNFEEGEDKQKTNKFVKQSFKTKPLLLNTQIKTDSVRLGSQDSQFQKSKIQEEITSDWSQEDISEEKINEIHTTKHNRYKVIKHKNIYEEGKKKELSKKRLNSSSEDDDGTDSQSYLDDELKKTVTKPNVIDKAKNKGFEYKSNRSKLKNKSHKLNKSPAKKINKEKFDKFKEQKNTPKNYKYKKHEDFEIMHVQSDKSKKKATDKESVDFKITTPHRKHVKTFITLYPEIINYPKSLQAMKTMRGENVEGRKTTKNYKLTKPTKAMESSDLSPWDSSSSSPENDDSKPNRENHKTSHPNILRHLNEITTSSKSSEQSYLRSHKSKEEKAASSLESVEYFGQLKKKENLSNEIKSFRKSNDIVSTVGITASLNDSTQIDDIIAETNATFILEDNNQTHSKKPTFGTLPYWSGTERILEVVTNAAPNVSATLLLENKTDSEKTIDQITTTPITEHKTAKVTTHNMKINYTEKMTSQTQPSSTVINLAMLLNITEAEKIVDEGKKKAIDKKMLEDMKNILSPETSAAPNTQPVINLDDAFDDMK